MCNLYPEMCNAQNQSLHIFAVKLKCDFKTIKLLQ